MSGTAEAVEDEGDLGREEGAPLAEEQLAQPGVVGHVEAQLGPGCARTDGREIELGKLRTAVGYYPGDYHLFHRQLHRAYPRALIVVHHDLNPAKPCPCIPDVAREYADMQPDKDVKV